MLPILISMLVIAPILALGTWLYLQRRTLSPRVRIVLMSILFLFVLLSGPVILWMWHHEGTTGEILSTGRGGWRFLGQFPFIWLTGAFGTGVQLFRLCRKKGEL
jgi:hypothetical protein